MYAYTFIRRDIPIQHQIVQACHSAYEAGQQIKKTNSIPNLILLDANSENHLFEIANFLNKNKISYYMFHEPDNNMGHTSITTEPLSHEKKKLLSNFKMWRPTC